MYTARLLQHLGLDFGHECIKKNGGIGYSFVTEEEWVVSKKIYEKVTLKDFDFVLHQVRNPLDVVRSLPVDAHPFWRLANKHVGPLTGTKLNRHFQLWERWNKLCEQNSIATYKIEDIPTEIDGITFNKNANTRVGTMKYISRPAWGDVPQEVVSLAEQYGYK
jgi:hypothetical protein